jgi:hypothetical protein
MKTYALAIALFAIILAGCQAPCLICSTPDEVVTSMEGQVGNLRSIEGALVDKLEDEDVKKIWKGRLAAFIAESRGTLAWAKKEDFDLKKVLEEERRD